MVYSRSRKNKCHSTGRVTARILFSFLALVGVSPLATAFDQIPLRPQPSAVSSASSAQIPRKHDFTLRHILHQGASHQKLHHRLDITSENAWRAEMAGDDELGIGPFRTTSTPTSIQRLVDRRVEDIQPMLDSAWLDGSLPPSAWTVDEVLAPDVTDKETVVNLAIMTANSYNQFQNDSQWENVTRYDLAGSFGWESDGIRGHIFADADNSTIVMAIKGTTVAVFDGAGTTTNDKENDNLFGSCCCGQGGQYLWRKVCDCMTSAYTCNQTCAVRALRAKNRYYQASLELYGNVTELYPNSEIWIVGHSLGGMIAALTGQTFGRPVVTFESYGQDLAAKRLGLPTPPQVYPGAARSRRFSGVWNFGHTADPVFMGTCNTATSSCTLGGYAFESQCFSGLRCVYDVVNDKQWRVSITTHSIRNTIRDVYRVYDEAAPCKPDLECVDCALWKFYESNGTESSTTSSSSTSSTSTRTTTCSTPGWFGCLDTSTTITTTSEPTTSTTMITTSVTCTHYGWFGGCLDPSTTTTVGIPTTTLPITSTATTFCKTPGVFFGCRDDAILPPTSTTFTTATSTTPTSTNQPTSCHTPGILFGCKDTMAAPSMHAITARPGL